MADRRHQNIGLTLVSPESRDGDNDDSVRLEQEPWDIDTGYITKFMFFQYLNHLLFDADPPEADCPTLGARNVYAYPSRPDLSYLIGCTWGTLGPCRINEGEFSEAIQCDLQTELATEYPPLEIIGYTWLGAAYSPEGDFLSNPAVTIDGDKLRIAQAVYGTLLVKYTVCQHIYSLSVPVRPGAAENTVQSHLYAVWAGGNTVIEIEQPEGAETGECNYGSSWLGDATDDDEPPDHVDPEDEHVNVDFCTGLEIAE